MFSLRVLFSSFFAFFLRVLSLLLFSSRVLFLNSFFSLPCSVSFVFEHLLSQNLRDACIIRNRLCQCTYLSNGTGSNITRNICPFKGRSSTESGTSMATLLNARVSLSIYARCASTAAFTSSSEENRISIR